jgi:hypothetical protein
MDHIVRKYVVSEVSGSHGSDYVAVNVLSLVLKAISQLFKNSLEFARNIFKIQNHLYVLH